jgi:hypothetical protein
MVPSFAMHFYPARYFSILCFFHKFKEKLKATDLVWCPDNDSATYKYLVEIRRLARNETPFLSAMQLRTITLAW